MPLGGTVEARFAFSFSRLFCLRSVFFECNGMAWVRSTSGSRWSASASASASSYKTVAFTFVLALALTAVLVLAISGGPATFTALTSLKVELREWRLDREVDVVVGILQEKKRKEDKKKKTKAASLDGARRATISWK